MLANGGRERQAGHGHGPCMSACSTPPSPNKRRAYDSMGRPIFGIRDKFPASTAASRHGNQSVVANRTCKPLAITAKFSSANAMPPSTVLHGIHGLTKHWQAVGKSIECSAAASGPSGKRHRWNQSIPLASGGKRGARNCKRIPGWADSGEYGPCKLASL